MSTNSWFRALKYRPVGPVLQLPAVSVTCGFPERQSIFTAGTFGSGAVSELAVRISRQRSPCGVVTFSAIPQTSPNAFGASSVVEDDGEARCAQ
ncbi:MAG: hypothetical protein JW940_19520 [Polyangiaceae bacterium]|nr:hypothetical protein [Polyangiaceae bacterium]